MAISEPPTHTPSPQPPREPASFDYRRFMPKVPDPLVAVFDVLSPSSLLGMAKRYWWILVGATVLGAWFSYYRASRQPISYTTTAQFIIGQGSTQLSGLAAQLGLASSGSLLENPSFIANLIHSRELLWGVANAKLRIDSLNPQRDTTVVDILGIRDTLPLRAKEIAVSTLRGWIGVAQLPNSIIELTVTTSNPRLSSAIALETINQVNRFNYDMRQRRLDAERSFIQRRLEITERELRDAEARLRSFLAQNRVIGPTSDLQFQHERLTSEVSMRRNFYQSAVMAHESARVEEIRDIPMTTLLEAPDIPLRPNERPKGRTIVVGAIAGFMLAVLIVLLLDLRRRVLIERAALS